MSTEFCANCMEDYSFLTLTLENEDEWERKRQLYREKIKQYSKVSSYNLGGTEQEIVLSIAKYYGFIDPIVSSCDEIGEDLEFVLYDVGETDEYIQYLCNIGKDPKQTKEYKR